jgi:hypothetical protein
MKLSPNSARHNDLENYWMAKDLGLLRNQKPMGEWNLKAGW